MWKPLTGEPDAGNSHVRFGGRGGESLLYPYRPIIRNVFFNFYMKEQYVFHSIIRLRINLKGVVWGGTVKRRPLPDYVLEYASSSSSMRSAKKIFTSD